MFVSPDQKKDLCISSMQIVLIKDKIRSLKTMYFFVVVLLNQQYFKMFSAILIKWQKNENFRTETLSADQILDEKKIQKFFCPKVFILNVP